MLVCIAVATHMVERDVLTFLAEMVRILLGRSHRDCSFTLITGVVPTICWNKTIRIRKCCNSYNIIYKLLNQAGPKGAYI